MLTSRLHARVPVARLRRNAAEGRKIIRFKGLRFGPKLKLSEYQQVKALDRLAAGDCCREIGHDMGVSNSTISRLLRPISDQRGAVDA